MNSFKVSTLLVVLMLLIGSPANAAYIDIVSQTYSMNLENTINCNIHPELCFNETTHTSPLVFDQNIAKGDFTASSADLYVYTLGYGGTVSAETIFRTVDSSWINVMLSANAMSGLVWLDLGINDLTLGTSESIEAFLDYNATESLIIPADSTHLYELWIHTESSSDSGYASAHIDVVPEPATLLLLGLGLIGLAGIRRKFKK